ncbi:gluconate:H+ symporter [Temperatibacter marinus]|uniref:Gluconate:H+ symporter n=1 Tax=Temperatibacter marinus TaxID=1456591 RepID=A0AA52H9A7_9PROT|nr:gluconate:H+ symporter [Temperatibacter marinus]WND02709.1 gluconate:H+ symporter [Temperatibacter marinus]
MIDFFINHRAVLSTVLAVIILLVMIIRFRISPFPALLTASLLAGLLAGLGVDKTLSAVQNGMGGTLGFIAVVVGLGSMLGVLIHKSGGIEQLSNFVTSKTPKTMLDWVLAFLGLLIAIPVFFDVALIIVAPILFALAQKIQKPVMYLALPLLAGLATAHAFIPPTPGPIAVANLLGAEIGLVIFYGFISGLVAVTVAGPLWVRFAEKIKWLPPIEENRQLETSVSKDEPGSYNLVGKCLFIIALPMGLILGASLIKMMKLSGVGFDVILFLGHPFAALLLSCALAYQLFRPTTLEGKNDFKKAIERALEPAGVIILVTGAGGAFKQILIDTGAGTIIADSIISIGFAPIVAAYIIAAVVRIAQGSATVAMITAAGFMAPLLSSFTLSPQETAMLVIAIAAGATGFSHVNDSGFWLVSRYFNLTPVQTAKTWTVSSSLVSLAGFGTLLILYFIV